MSARGLGYELDLQYMNFFVLFFYKLSCIFNNKFTFSPTKGDYKIFKRVCYMSHTQTSVNEQVPANVHHIGHFPKKENFANGIRTDVGVLSICNPVAKTPTTFGFQWLFSLSFLLRKIVSN